MLRLERMPRAIALLTPTKKLLAAAVAVGATLLSLAPACSSSDPTATPPVPSTVVATEPGQEPALAPGETKVVGSLQEAYELTGLEFREPAYVPEGYAVEEISASRLPAQAPMGPVYAVSERWRHSDDGSRLILTLRTGEEDFERALQGPPDYDVGDRLTINGNPAVIFADLSALRWHTGDGNTMELVPLTSTLAREDLIRIAESVPLD